MTTETNHNASHPVPTQTKAAHELPQDWQRARQRILLYLQHLDLSAVQGLELALEALRRSQQKTCGGEPTAIGHPIVVTMAELRELLAEKGLLVEDQSPYGEEFKYSDLFLKMPVAAAGAVGICSMPPLNRQSMKPETFD